MIITKSVKQIIIINFIVFAVTYLFSLYGLYLNNIFALSPIYSDYFQPLQLITHLFAHANFNHVFFNMLFLFLFGPGVENYFGSKNFWKLYILAGLFSSGLYCLIDSIPILGASGAVFAIMTAYIYTNYKNTVNFLSINIKSYAFILSFIFLELYLSLFSKNDNIGHWAHIFGSIFACLYILAYKFKKII